MAKRDERGLGDKKTLLCPLHSVSEPLLGSKFTRFEFDLLEFEGMAPVSLLMLRSLEEELVRCPHPDCKFNAVWHCPLCRFWRARVDSDSKLPTWKCSTSFKLTPCPFKMTLPLDKPERERR